MAESDSFRESYEQLYGAALQEINDVLDYQWRMYQPFYQEAYQAVCRHSPHYNHYVDIGSGMAASAVPLPDKSRFVGVDFSHRSMRMGRALFPEAVFVTGDAMNLPLARDLTDAVVCLGSMEHFPDVPHSLREIRRIMKPGGVFALLIPNVYDLGLYYFANLTRLARWRDRLLGRAPAAQEDARPPGDDATPPSPQEQGRPPFILIQGAVLAYSWLSMAVHYLTGRTPALEEESEMYTDQPVDRQFTRRDLDTLLGEAGFEVLERHLVSPDYPSYPGLKQLLSITAPPAWRSAHLWLVKKPLA